MRLYLLRHGIAISREDPECPPDEERFLTPRGIRRTRAAARGLAALGLEPTVILTSPLVRAEQTAAIAAQILGRKAPLKRTGALLPESDPAMLLGEAGRLEGDVLCVGHAPNLDEVLVTALQAEACAVFLKKAGAACLEHDETGYRLVWFLDPRTLRAIGRRDSKEPAD